MKILIAEEMHPILRTNLEIAGISCETDTSIGQADLMHKAKNFSGIVIRSRFKADAGFIEANRHLKFIARLGAGMENIDTEYAKKCGIACINSPEGNKDALAEHALGMLLALSNHLFRANAEIKQGKWLRNPNRGTEITGKTICIIGYGNMGSAFAERLSGFGAEVCAYDKYKAGFTDKFVKEVCLDQIFERSDILSLHVPLTEETHYLVDEDFIQKFKKPFYLINTARGKVLHTKSLSKALKSGKIKGAALDVLEYEKSDFENLYAEKLPPEFEYLLKSDKVILSPHIAGRTFESEKKLAQVLAEKIINRFGIS